MENGAQEAPFNTAKREEMGQYSSAKALHGLDDSVRIERVDDSQDHGPIPRESQLQSVNFCKHNSTIETTGLDGSALSVQITVNLEILRLFALLMCKGSIRDKAARFFEVIIGPLKAEANNDNETVAWKSGRMVNAFKKLVYFSEIFPKKYWGEFMNNKTPRQGLNNISIASAGAAAKLGPATPKGSVPDRREKFFWSDSYLFYAE